MAFCVVKYSFEKMQIAAIENIKRKKIVIPYKLKKKCFSFSRLFSIISVNSLIIKYNLFAGFYGQVAFFSRMGIYLLDYYFPINMISSENTLR